jgi:ABC-type sugar transport system ATPase subunit
MSLPETAASERIALRAAGIRKAYGFVQALAGAYFELREGEIHALIGDNGAGKSTLIKIFSGVLQPDDGTIEHFGTPVAFSNPAEARDAGIETVYQDLALATDLTPGENIYLGREIERAGFLGRIGFVDRSAMRRAASKHLRQLGIDLPSGRAPVETLSGGQRQAVAVARASAWGRTVLIMDEPVAALGHQQTEIVLGLMKQIRDDKGLSVLFISHSIPQVLEVADRITVLRLGRTVLTCEAGDADTEMLLAAMTGVTGTDEGAWGHGSRDA